MAKPSILITAEIDSALTRQLEEREFIVDVIPFIQTEIIHSEKLKQQIESILKLKTTVVFTSNNAVKAIAEFISIQKPDWKIYCTGNTTKTSAEILFGKQSIAGFGNNATEVANQIISNKKITEVYFFCGDKKRDELPALLTQHNIVVHEIEVYKTIIIKQEAGKNYDAVLFFSPSAVESFFAANNINNKTALFAIGSTTADEIQKYTSNKIVISETPAKKEVIKKVEEFFRDYTT